MAIQVTEGATAKIRALIADGDHAGKGLRIKVVGGGCSGLQYKMDLDVEKQGDKLFGEPDAPVIVDRRSFLYLNGTELDYGESLMESGFNLRNPNVKKTCGCGASFSV